jgi:hypothetical protein
MTEPQPAFRSSDASDYPASPEEAIGRARVIELPTGEGGPDIESAARSIGSALGRAVSRVRETRDEIRDRVDEATYRLRSQAKEASRNYSAVAQEKLESARFNARDLAWRATRDYPVHVILGTALAGVLIGAGLRIWRENRDEPYQPYLR